MHIRSDKENREIMNSYTVTSTVMHGAIGMVYNKFYLYKPMRYLSKIIRRVRNSPANHCFTLYKLKGVWYVSEAIEKGIVNTTTLESKIAKWKRNGDIVIIKYPPKANSKLRSLIKEYEGTRYGFWTLIKFLWATITRKPLRSRKAREYKHFVCSQWCALLDGRPDAYRYSPKEIFDLQYPTKRLLLDFVSLKEKK